MAEPDTTQKTSIDLSHIRINGKNCINADPEGGVLSFSWALEYMAQAVQSLWRTPMTFLVLEAALPQD